MSEAEMVGTPPCGAIAVKPCRAPKMEQSPVREEQRKSATRRLEGAAPAWRHGAMAHGGASLALAAREFPSVMAPDSPGAL